MGEPEMGNEIEIKFCTIQSHQLSDAGTSLQYGPYLFFAPCSIDKVDRLDGIRRERRRSTVHRLQKCRLLRVAVEEYGLVYDRVDPIENKSVLPSAVQGEVRTTREHDERRASAIAQS